MIARSYSLWSPAFHGLVLCLTLSAFLLGGSSELKKFVREVSLGVRHFLSLVYVSRGTEGMRASFVRRCAGEVKGKDKYDGRVLGFSPPHSMGV